jgi:Lysozyme like domain
VIRLLAALVLVVVFGAPLLGYAEQPWWPWWVSTPGAFTLPTGVDSVPLGPITLPIGPQPLVSDVERFQLARGAGWNLDEAITATALSIAEDGGGDPAALSGVNRDGSRDLGLWQINSSHWPSCGGQEALIVPTNNAACAHGVYVAQGWCAWSTYDARCGPGHTGSFSSYIPRAVLASR